MLSHIDAEEIVFKLSSPVRAAIISPAKQREHEDLLMLVMPMRLNT
jgi:DNA polymerase III sliding clamp (beta) subunit (PCNA family)